MYVFTDVTLVKLFIGKQRSQRTSCNLFCTKESNILVHTFPPTNLRHGNKTLMGTKMILGNEQTTVQQIPQILVIRMSPIVTT